MSKTSANRRKFSPTKLKERRERFMPRGTPKYVRCYDNGGVSAEGGSSDRYSVIFTGRYGHLTGRETWMLSMSGAPFHPQGIGMHSGLPHMHRPDVGKGSWGGPSIGRRCHLGVRIRFEDLPEDCQTCVLQDYEYLWDLTVVEHPMARDPFQGSVLYEKS